MKTNISFATLLTVILGMVACMMSSCSGEKEDKLYSYVPDNAETIVSLNLKAIAENAGCRVSGEGIELSPALEKLIKDDPRVISLLKAEGVDLNRVIAVIENVKNAGDDMFLIARVTDESGFEEYLTANGLQKSSQSGKDIYTYGEDCTVIVENGIALYVPTGENGLQTANTLRASAEKYPVASWKVDFLENSTISALIDFDAYLKLADTSVLGNFDKMLKTVGLENTKGVQIAMNVELNGEELRYMSKLMDIAGKKIELDIEVGNLNTSLLKYTNSVDCFALLFALPSADFVSKIVDAADLNVAQKASFLSAYAYFKSIMIAGGPIDITSYYDTNSWHLVLAAEMQEGKAQEVFNLISSVAPSFSVPVETSGDDIAFRLPGKLTGYIKKDGNNLVASLMKPVSTDGGSAIKASDFGKYPAEAVVKIPAHASGTTYLDLPFGINFKSYSDDGESVSILKLTDSKGGILQNIIEVVAEHK